jgi:hypothetical protein
LQFLFVFQFPYLKSNVLKSFTWDFVGFPLKTSKLKMSSITLNTSSLACVAAIVFDPSLKQICLKQIWSYCSRHGQDDGSGMQLILRPSVCVRL